MQQGMEFLSIHSFVRQTVLDRIRGTIFGSALGDTIGLYTEFLSRDLSFEAYPEGKFQLVSPATELRNDGHRSVCDGSNRLLPYKFTKCTWTDDTDHALLIILSYLHHDGTVLSPFDLATRLRFWCEQGLRCLDRLPMGLGQTVGRVVCDPGYLSNPASIAHKHWATGKYKAAANGSLMRTHPLGILCLAKPLADTFQVAADFSVVTHADPRCVVSCCIATGLTRGLLRGDVLDETDVDALVARALGWTDAWIERRKREPGHEADPPLDHDELHRYVQAQSIDELQLDDARTMGYVYKSLGAGVLALRLAMRSRPQMVFSTVENKENVPGGNHANNLFERLITTLVMYGGDADTNACVAGALLGAFVGFNALPAHWREGMEHRSWLLGKCDGLAYVLGIGQGLPEYKGSEDADTRVDGGKGTLTREELEAREKAFMEMYMSKLSLGNKGERREKQSWMGKLLGGNH